MKIQYYSFDNDLVYLVLYLLVSQLYESCLKGRYVFVMSCNCIECVLSIGESLRFDSRPPLIVIAD